MRLAILAAGFLAGIVAAWWWLGANQARWLGVVNADPDWTAADPYLRDLAAILERERW